MISHWGDLQRSYDYLSKWVKDTERRLQTDTEYMGDLAEKKAQAGKFKVS